MRKVRVNEAIVSFCLFILGICLLLWADKVTNMVSILFGSILILYGVINGITYLINKERDTLNILFVVTVLVIGIVLVSRPSIVAEVISFIVGIYIVLSSISNLKSSLSNKESENYKMSLILSIVGIILGILSVVGKILLPNLVLRYLGLMLVIFSVIDIINLFLLPNPSDKKMIRIINVKNKD